MIGWLIARVDEVPDDESWLLPAERDILAGLLVAKRRVEWRLGRWAAKHAVAAAFDINAGGIEVRAAADGAPEAWRDGARLPLALSLSHRAGTAACAVALPAEPLGCDVELVEARAPAFATEWFLPGEPGTLGGADPEQRDLATTMAWSAKESAFKMLRCGLRRDPRSLQVVRREPRAVQGWFPLQVRDLDSGGRADAWWRVEGRLVLTVAATAMPTPPRPLRTRRAARLYDCAV